MLVSMLIPSRARPEKLLKSINQLIVTAFEPENIEFCIRVDDDDDETIAILPQLREIHPNIKIKVGDRMDGYESLHYMYDELCHISSGTFLYLWNDDSYMKTEGWDLILSDYTDRYSWIMTGEYFENIGSSYQSSFPCMHRKLWEIMGRFSAHPHNDTYQALVINFFENQWRAFRNFISPDTDMSSIHSTHPLAVNCTTGGTHQEDEIIEIEHTALECVIHPENFQNNVGMLSDLYSPIYQEVIDDAMKLLKYFVLRGGDFTIRSDD